VRVQGQGTKVLEQHREWYTWPVCSLYFSARPVSLLGTWRGGSHSRAASCPGRSSFSGNQTCAPTPSAPSISPSMYSMSTSSHGLLHCASLGISYLHRSSIPSFSNCNVLWMLSCPSWLLTITVPSASLALHVKLIPTFPQYYSRELKHSTSL